MEYDYSKLKGRIIEKFNTYTAFAEAIGSVIQTVSAKLNNEVGITKSDILLWSKTLELSLSDIGPYFFTVKV